MEWTPCRSQQSSLCPPSTWAHSNHRACLSWHLLHQSSQQGRRESKLWPHSDCKRLPGRRLPFKPPTWSASWPTTTTTTAQARLFISRKWFNSRNNNNNNCNRPSHSRRSQHKVQRQPQQLLHQLELVEALEETPVWPTSLSGTTRPATGSLRTEKSAEKLFQNLTIS